MSAISEFALEDYLARLPDLGARPQGAMSASDFTLERMRSLMVALDHPEQKYPTLHIAGTNGKGSVSALCGAALQAQGYRVGLFTSPHLHGALQGISINGNVAEQFELEESFQAMRPQLVLGKGWTNFEVVTALAFLHFARRNVDAAVIEVGLGGRLDATNAITPLVSVITSIDYDHTAILGERLEQIADEKAGIIKPGVPAVISPQMPEAREALIHAALEKGARLTEVGKDVLFEQGSFDLTGQDLRVWRANELEKAQPLRISLLGTHQVENAATAYAALQAAKERGLALDEMAIRQGFAEARWPGRFEILQENPLLVLDAAHSPAAARALRQALDDYFKGKPVILILGVSVDKDLESLITSLQPHLRHIIATQSAHPRAWPAEDLQGRLTQLGLSAQNETDPARALKTALDQAGDKEVVLVCGSVFLMEQIRESYFATK